MEREFPGGLVVRTWCCCGPGSIPGWGTKILQAVWPKEKKERKGKKWCGEASYGEVARKCTVSKGKICYADLNGCCYKQGKCPKWNSLC